jgi:tetratricopeptide (TPR) repeat protein
MVELSAAELRVRGEEALDAGQYQAAYALLTDASEVADDDEHEAALIETALGRLAVDLSDLPKAEVLLRRAIQTFTDLRDERCEHDARYQLGRWAVRAARPAEAVELFEAALGEADRRGDLHDVAWRTHDLGHALMFIDLQGAMTTLRRAAHLHDEVGDEHGRCWAILQLGQAMSTAGDHAAEETLREAIALSEHGGDDAGIVFGSTRLGDLLRYEGRAEEAKVELDLALAAARRTGSRSDERAVQQTLGLLAASEQDWDAARHHLGISLAIADSSRDELNASRARNALARCHLALGRFEEAKALAAEALAWATENDSLAEALEARLHLTRCAVRSDDLSGAVEQATAGVATAAAADLRRMVVADLELELAIAYRRNREFDDAEVHAIRASELAASAFEAHRAALAAAELARLCELQGRPADAVQACADHLQVASLPTRALLLLLSGRNAVAVEQVDVALAHLREADALYEELGNAIGRAACLEQLAVIADRRGDALGGRRLRRIAKELGGR